MINEPCDFLIRLKKYMLNKITFEFYKSQLNLYNYLVRFAFEHKLNMFLIDICIYLTKQQNPN